MLAEYAGASVSKRENVTLLELKTAFASNVDTLKLKLPVRDGVFTYTEKNCVAPLPTMPIEDRLVHDGADDDEVYPEVVVLETPVKTNSDGRVMFTCVMFTPPMFCTEKLTSCDVWPAFMLLGDDVGVNATAAALPSNMEKNSAA